MTTLDDRATVSSTVLAEAHTDRLRGSRPLAAALVAAPVLLGAGVAAHPDDTQGAARTLEAVSGDSATAWALTHLLEPFGWVLLGTTLLLALPRLSTGRGRRLLDVGAVMSAVGFSALAFIVYAHGEAYRHMAATDVEPSTFAPLVEQFDGGMPLAGPLSLLGRIGLLLAVIGLIRARAVPAWAALLLLSPVVLFGIGAGLPSAVLGLLVFGPLTVGLAACARRIAREGGPGLGARA